MKTENLVTCPTCGFEACSRDNPEMFRRITETPSIETPLRCSIEGGDLVMRIGIGTLAWAAKKKNGGPIENGVRITDKAELAKDVANELMRQDELGNSPIAELIDEAIQSAADQGSAAFVYPRK